MQNIPQNSKNMLWHRINQDSTKIFTLKYKILETKLITILTFTMRNKQVFILTVSLKSYVSSLNLDADDERKSRLNVDEDYEY